MKKNYYLCLLTKKSFNSQENKLTFKKSKMDGKSKLFLGAPLFGLKPYITVFAKNFVITNLPISFDSFNNFETGCVLYFWKLRNTIVIIRFSNLKSSKRFLKARITISQWKKRSRECVMHKGGGAMQEGVCVKWTNFC